MFLYISICSYMCLYMYIYIYIYIQREREREREIDVAIRGPRRTGGRPARRCARRPACRRPGRRRLEWKQGGLTKHACLRTTNNNNNNNHHHMEIRKQQ